jgi:hypothetical protein
MLIMDSSITTMVRKIYDLIPDINTRLSWSGTRNRAARGLIDGTGDA